MDIVMIITITVGVNMTVVIAVAIVQNLVNTNTARVVNALILRLRK